MSSASFSAARPASPVTSGSLRSRHAFRNAASSAVRGSCAAHGHGPGHDARGARQAVEAEGRHVALLGVDREVPVGLEEAELPRLLLRDARGRQVRDAPALEREAHGRDVDLVREDRHADGADLDHGPPHEVERDVEVVDEEVEDDVHVERARHEHAEAVRLDELHVRHERPNGGDRRVEALDVSDLQDAALLARDRDEAVRLGERRRDGLLDHDVGAAREQLLGDRGVRDGRRRDDDGRRARVEELT